ncbi:hypothetical protein [Photobacterium kishitanii]|uniref:Uncharacterized protein n=1 Tax=Photobacterium kishitanii TaxID=318456 RepID=A0A2T3KMF7_9GAMM|nr:hypothetical protein [Photobacterium kishitanii]PSV00968.1 hypothetical protein C9J27_02785 [Photobacterium kishitanii]
MLKSWLKNIAYRSEKKIKTALGVSLHSFIAVLFFIFISPSAFADVADQAANADFGCSSAYDANGVILPFNWTICPTDKSMEFAYNLFPNAMAKASDLVNLEYKTEIENHLNAKNNTNIAGKLASGNKVELIVSIVRTLTLWFLSLIAVVQILAFALKSLSDGMLGGKDWGGFGTVASVLFGVVLFLPVGDGVYVGDLILSILFIVGLGFANVAVSSVLYTMHFGSDQEGVLGAQALEGSVLARDISNADNKREVRESDASEQASMNISRLVETAVCVKETAKILDANYVNDTEGFFFDGNSIKGVLGLYSTPSFMGDGNSTKIEIADASSGVKIIHGANIDPSGKGRKDGIPEGVCGTEFVIKPSLTLAKSKYSDLLSTDMKNNLDGSVDKAVGDLVKGNANSGEISSQLETIKNKVLANMAKRDGNSDGNGLTNTQKIDLLRNLGDYFYQSIVFKMKSGRWSGNSISEPTKNYYAKITSAVDNIVKGIGISQCATNYVAYKTTKQTIDSLNNGKIPDGSTFELKCAVATPNGLKMEFDADPSSYESFVSSTLLNVSNMTVDSSKSYKELKSYLGGIFRAIEDSRDNYETAISKDIGKEEKEKDTGSSESAKLLREGGYAAFGAGFLSLFTNSEASFYSSQPSLPSILPTFISQFNSGFGYVANGVTPNKDLKYIPSAITLPAFLYEGGKISGNTSTNDIERIIFSKMDSLQATSMGGNANTSGVQLVGAENVGTLLSLQDAMTANVKDTLLHIMPILGLPSTTLSAFSTGAIKKISNANMVNVADIRYALNDYCVGKSRFGENINTHDNSSSRVFNKLVCDEFNRHPLTYYADMGRDLTNRVGLLVFLMGAGNYATKKVESVAEKAILDKKHALEKLNSSKGSVGAAGGGAIKSTSVYDLQGTLLRTMKSLIVSMSNIATVGAVTLLIIGIAFGYVLPMVPFVAFTTGWIAYMLMFAQAMAVSMLLCGGFLVLRGRDERSSIMSPKGYINTVVNFLFRPLATVVAFSLAWSMVYAGLQGFNYLALMIMGSSSGLVSISGEDVSLFALIMSMLVCGIGQFTIVTWVFSLSSKAVNDVITKLGGDSLDGREGHSVAMLAPMVLIGMSNNRRMPEKMIRAREKIERGFDRVGKVLTNSVNKARAQHKIKDYEAEKSEGTGNE